MQIMKLFQSMFSEMNADLILKPYDIVVTSSDSGFLEFVADSYSIDQLKKDLGSDLNYIFRNLFKNNFRESQLNFVRSLAGYSLFCYLLQIKGKNLILLYLALSFWEPDFSGMLIPSRLLTTIDE